MTQTITLGGRTFALRPLRLGQLRHVLDALDEMSRQSGGGLIAAAAKVVAAGLAPAHPDLTADALLDLEAGVDALNAAVAAVLRTAGLRPLETEAGEARSPDGRPPPAAVPGRPDTAPAPSSAPSTLPSPPAAAGATATSTN
jgi:hypothetical protein